MTERAPGTTTGPHPTATVQWHELDAEVALGQLDATLDGLGAGEAAQRLAAYGPNELVDKGSKKPLTILWEQITAVMVLILIAASALSLALGKFLEAGTILAIVVLFALLGFLQEYRAEKAIAALKRLAVPSVRVYRNGQLTESSATDLVPGDIVALEAGNVVPADLRLVENANLRIQEAALTGESEPVEKQVAAIPGNGAPLGDRRNMAYLGTQITYGRGTGLVVGTGMDTELGKIATLLQEVVQEETPLQQRLDKVGKQLALGGVIVALLVMVVGALGGEPLGDLVLTAISVAVAVIPEGLPAVVTFTLAIGAQRMLRRQALVRKLPAVETLGSVTTICSDKTGTLTENRMTVTQVDTAGDDTATRKLLLAAGSLCNDARMGPEGEWIGDPTETAIVVAAAKDGIDPEALRLALPRAGELPFDSDRKRMTTGHVLDTSVLPELALLAPAGTPVSFTKGAVDGLVQLASGVFEGGEVKPIDDHYRERIESANAAMASDGVRVLGVAYRTVGDASSVDDAEADLVILGLVGMIDPPRAEVRDAVAVCRTAGIRPVMITGDHPLTASSIARDLGISDDGRVVTGVELERMSDADLPAVVEDVSVFARVSPEHKLRIVEALRGKGHVVAMTGDGVNDAPALRKADIGVAMGITGTDVSKEASDMVLRDDNFATIVAAVEEGRVIYDNLRRFVKFAVAGNIGKVLVMLFWPIPYLLSGGEVTAAVALLPLQLLWLNLMTDGLLGLSMGMEPAERSVMRRPPHSPSVGIFSGGLGFQAIWSGLLIGATTLAIGYAYHESGNATWQTMMFTSLAILQVFQALGTRSNAESLFTIGLLSNRVMLGVIGLVSILQLLAIYTPLRDFLSLARLSGLDLLVCVGAGLALLVVLEIDKAIRRSRRTARAAPPASQSGKVVAAA
jgi:Ca2+-transporting ATPase